MINFLKFLEGHQTIYITCCLLFFLLFLLSAVKELIVSKTQENLLTTNFLVSDYSFLFLASISIFIARLPILVYFSELNVDESLMLTEAITIREKLFFWKYIDPTTHGPFDIYPLILLSFGGAINYFTIRLTWFICVVGIVASLYFTKKEIFKQKIARLSIIPVVSFFCFYKYTDFTNYSSEHIPMLFLGVSCYLLAKNYKSTTLNHRHLYLIGLLLGAIPFAKLQAVPIALFFGLSTLFLIVQKQDFSVQKAIRPISLTLLGSLTIPLISLLIIVFSDSFTEFWQMYFLDNFGYASSEKQITILECLMMWIKGYTGLGGASFLTLSGLTFLLLSLFFYKRGVSKKGHFSMLFFLLCLFIISLYCTIAPKRLYPHYLLFLVQPISLLGAFLFTEVYLGFKQFQPARYAFKAFIAFFMIGAFAIGTGQQLGLINKSALLNNQLFGRLVTTYEQVQNNPTSKIIEKYSTADDPIVVWGYEPKIHVNSQRFSGTPYHFVSSLVGSHLPQESMAYHQENFIQHFQKNMPKVFIDATGPGNFRFTSKEKYTFKNIPALAKIIKNDYTFLSKSENVAVYIRN